MPDYEVRLNLRDAIVRVEADGEEAAAEKAIALLSREAARVIVKRRALLVRKQPEVLPASLTFGDWLEQHRHKGLPSRAVYALSYQGDLDAPALEVIPALRWKPLMGQRNCGSQTMGQIADFLRALGFPLVDEPWDLKPSAPVQLEDK